MGRSFSYQPNVDRPDYQARNLRHVVGGVFGGDPMALVRRLISSQGLSGEDLLSLRELVESTLDE